MADGHAIFSKVAVEALGVACLQHHAVPSDSHLLICKMDLLFLCLVVTWFRLVVLRRLSQACATHCLFRFLLSIFALLSFFLSFFLSFSSLKNDPLLVVFRGWRVLGSSNMFQLYHKQGALGAHVVPLYAFVTCLFVTCLVPG